MKTAKEIFSIFQGKWNITRDIIHNPIGTSPGETYQATGIAEFTQSPSSNATQYIENIEVVNLDSTGIFRGYQKYEYRFAKEDNILCKYFADGRLFYVLDIQGNKAHAEHLCGLDLYQAEYSFIDEENFQLEYKVKGPNKDYRIFTMFER